MEKISSGRLKLALISFCFLFLINCQAASAQSLFGLGCFYFILINLHCQITSAQPHFGQGWCSYLPDSISPFFTEGIGAFSK